MTVKIFKMKNKTDARTIALEGMEINPLNKIPEKIYFFRSVEGHYISAIIKIPNSEDIITFSGLNVTNFIKNKVDIQGDQEVQIYKIDYTPDNANQYDNNYLFNVFQDNGHYLLIGDLDELIDTYDRLSLRGV